MIFKRWFLYLFFALSVFLFPLNVNAQTIEKEIELELPNDYIQCTFYISPTSGYSIEQVYVLTPNEKKIEGIYNEPINKYTAVIPNAKAGLYTVIVSKDIEDHIDISDYEKIIEDEIGKITVSVKADSEATQIVDKDIKLAKEISGLKYYWKDDSIVVKWDDETIGDVNIQVIDSNTLEILCTQKINNQYFEFPVKNTVKEILLYITPSVSQNIEGAGEQYVIPVENNPDGKVIFDNIEFTNKDYLSATIELNNNYSLIYTNNDQEVGSTKLLNAGTHEIQIPTVLGDNIIKVYIVDEKNNMRSTSKMIYKDVEPPILKIEKDINGITTQDDSINISGLIEDYDSFIFRNEPISVNWDGTFSLTVPLNEGENELILTASDKAGNITEYNAIIIKPIKKSIEIPWKLLIIIFCFIILVILLYILKPKINFPQTKTKNEKLKILSKEKAAVEDYLSFFISLILYAILIFGVFQFAIVQSSSMEPSINKNEFIITNKLAYKINKPQRGDIVTFKTTENENILLKRVIGLPGDKISFIDGYLFVNDIICDEQDYLNLTVETNSNQEFFVPDNQYFLLGDNRENSFDSRYWDNPYISINNIKGKLLFHFDFSW